MFQTRPNANFTAQPLKGGSMSFHTNFDGIQGTHFFYFPLICFVVGVRTDDFNSDLDPRELTKLEHKTTLSLPFVYSRFPAKETRHIHLQSRLRGLDICHPE